LSVFEDFIKAVGALTIALIVIYYVSTLQYWFFSVSALIGWTVAEFFYEQMDTKASTDPIDFVFYGITILIATAAGAFVVQQLIPDVSSASQQALSSHPLDIVRVTVYSFIGGAIAYVVPNISILLYRVRNRQKYRY
jgi:hypothetical protein